MRTQEMAARFKELRLVCRRVYMENAGRGDRLNARRGYPHSELGKVDDQVTASPDVFGKSVLRGSI